ncbi:hypothetical protein OAJ82_00805 [Alphaproteobacteria bacterium]|nr:hypothetical protein [Alphaproteobacteria bacterium]
MLVGKEHLTTIWFDNKKLSIQIIDQRFLPHDLKIITLNTLEETEYAIRKMQVRGAPLIGVTAAFGMYLTSLRDSSNQNLNKSVLFLKKARPTVVNLSWTPNYAFNVTSSKFITKIITEKGSINANKKSIAGLV